jgi:ABC-type dipeptide/oligopeptide/nickel transport system permease component
MEQAQAHEHAVRLVNEDDLRRSRLTVFFRLLLALPHFVWLALWSLVATLVAFVGWVVAIFTGRLPDPLHAFLVRYARYFTHVYAYYHLLSEPFPGFGGQPGYPVDLDIDPAQAQSRLTVLFRWLLAIPAFLLAYVFRLVMSVLAFIGWFYALATGRMSGGIENLGNYALRYEAQTLAYSLLVMGRYPSLGGGPTA